MSYKYEGLSDKVIIARLKGLQEELTSIIDCMNNEYNEDDNSIVSDKEQTVKQASLNNSVRQKIYDIVDNKNKFTIDNNDNSQQDLTDMFPKTKSKNKHRKRTSIRCSLDKNNNVVCNMK